MLRGILDRTAESVGIEMTNQPAVETELRSLLGKLYLDQQRYEAALAALLLARDMLGEIQSTYYVESERGITTLHKTVGEDVFTTLLANVEPRASYIVEQVLNEET